MGKSESKHTSGGELRRLPGGWGDLAGVVLFTIAAGCLVPGSHYPVSPAIGGSVKDYAFEAATGDLRLDLVHRENPELFERQEATVDPDGHFSFDATDLDIAGHEYSKHYRVFLHYRSSTEDRVIWRAEFARTQLSGPVELECDLRRPTEHGQPCRVVDARRHAWLVAQGEETFERLCARCHGDGGSRAGWRSSDPAETPPDLRWIAARRAGRFDSAEIAEWIEGRSIPEQHGTRQMPIWGERLATEYERFADADALVGATLDPVLAYLESIQLAPSND